MLEINESNFEKEIKGSKLVVIKFEAEWCGPCRAMAPIFGELSKEMKDVKFAKLDVDRSPNIASQLEVMGIPTFIVFKNGKEADRFSGAVPKSLLKSKIESAIKK